MHVSLDNLNNLTELTLYNNPALTHVSLDNLNNLTELSLYDTQLTDVSALKNLTSLTQLELGNNQLTDVSALANLKNLTKLDLYYTQLTHVSLDNLTSLERLSLYENPALTHLVLDNLNNLTELRLDNNPALTEVSLENLTSLEYLYLDNNPALMEVSLSGLTNVSSMVLRENLPQLTSVSLMDAAGSPMKEVGVSFSFYARGSGEDKDLYARTDANGKISIPAEKLPLPPDSYSVRARAQGSNLFSQQSTITFTFAGASVQQVNRADVNGDGIVNIQDLVLVSSHFGETGTHPADVNGDGVVNVQDLVLVSNAFN